MRCIFAIRLLIGDGDVVSFRRYREVSRSFGRRSVVQTWIIFPSVGCFGTVGRWV